MEIRDILNDFYCNGEDKQTAYCMLQIKKVVEGKKIKCTCLTGEYVCGYCEMYNKGVSESAKLFDKEG